VFLARHEGTMYRLSPDEMTRACRCHSDLLEAGFIFNMDLSGDAGFFYGSPITQRGGRARESRARPPPLLWN
jgi:hypothetical protein